MTPEHLASLIGEIEQTDPPDFDRLAIDAEGARRLMAAHLCELDHRLAEAVLGSEERLEMMAAIAAHTMVENMLLQLARLRRGGSEAEFRAWMKRHGMG